MKLAEKAILIGILCFVLFMYGNIFLGNLIGVVIPGGDDFLNSYFLPLYAGVTTLISLIISCTYIIVKKINLLLEQIKESK